MTCEGQSSRDQQLSHLLPASTWLTGLPKHSAQNMANWGAQRPGPTECAYNAGWACTMTWLQSSQQHKMWRRVESWLFWCCCHGKETTCLPCDEEQYDVYKHWLWKFTSTSNKATLSQWLPALMDTVELCWEQMWIHFDFSACVRVCVWSFY